MVRVLFRCNHTPQKALLKSSLVCVCVCNGRDLTEHDIKLIILSLRCSPSAVPACPTGWTGIENKCFKYNGGSRNYQDSVKYCKSQGATIASIHSEKQNEVVIKLSKKVAYIGAESDGEGNWKWNDGSQWWQPKAHAGLAGEEETKIALQNEWHDWGNGNKDLGVICAKTPGTITGLCLCEVIFSIAQRTDNLMMHNTGKNAQRVACSLPHTP